MDGSSRDESTSSDSTSLSPTTPLPFPPATNLSPLASLSRLGSGASVTIDSEITSAASPGGCTVLDQAESRKLPSSKYKGVVPQPNGRWGAQIYEKHQRVWLGTFNEENEAAKAYDIAAQRFRGRDAITNFKPLSEAIQNDDVEMAFLNSHSKSEIVDMLRKHTYDDELQQSKRTYSLLNKDGKRFRSIGNNDVFCSTSERNSKTRELLFEKSVTPSDVGKLNRLVIPKQHAEKHFPLHTNGNGNGGVNGVSAKGLLLNFEDVGEKVWRFRYSYWNSSQSYVLTKGWSRFVKEKNLKAGDVVCFLRSAGPDKQLFIDWKKNNGSGHVVRPVNSVQVVRLFGVNILKAPASSCDKKNPGLDLLGLQCGKKQRIIGAL